MLLDVRQREARRHLLRGIDGEDHVDAAPRPRRCDARQPTRARLVEVGREVGDGDEAIRFRNLRVGVVRTDRFVFVAEVLLDHHFHLLGDVGQLLLDQLRLRPDAAGDEELVVVGEMHETGKLFAEAERIDDGESGLTGRKTRGDAQHHRLHHRRCRFLLLGRRFDQEG